MKGATRYSIKTALTCVLILAARNGLAAAKHLVTLDDLLTLRDLSYLQLSPDGKRLAYTTGDGSLWLTATCPRSQPEKLGRGMLPHWSPDGKYLAYYSAISGTMQLWILEPAVGHRSQLTHFRGGIHPDSALSLWFYDSWRYSWSPDSTRLVFTSIVESDPKLSGEGSRSKGHQGSTSPLVLDDHTPADWTLSGLLPGHGRGVSSSENSRAGVRLTRSANQLFVVHVRSRRIEQLTRDNMGHFHPDWSPNGRKILYVSAEEGPTRQDGARTSNIFTIDLQRRTNAALTSTAFTKRMPSWSPDGQWIAFLGRHEFGLQAIFVIPSTGGPATNLTYELDRNIMEYGWSSDARSIVAISADGVSWPVLRVPLDKTDSEQISESVPAFRTLLTVSGTGTLAWVESNGSRTGIVKVQKRDSSGSFVLLDSNPQIRSWDLGDQRVVRWKNNRDENMEGILILPVEYVDGKHYPLIVDAYPHIADGFKGDPMLGNQAWASRGYAVFFPNARAPHVYNNFFKSEAFDHAADGPSGWDVTLTDVISGVDELVRLGIADPEKVALYGFSNGGGIANYLVTRTHRFKCAVSVAGALADWIRPVFLRTDSPVPTWAEGATPWNNPEDYIQLSAVFHLNTVRTPVLLADGDLDGEFLLDTIEMYNGLRWFARPVTLLRYPGQGHGFSGNALKDFWQREAAFLDKCTNSLSESVKP